MDERAMTIRCACGWEATGTEDQIVAAATAHGQHLHNMTPTREQVLAMVIPGAAEADRATDPEAPSAR